MTRPARGTGQTAGPAGTAPSAPGNTPLLLRHAGTSRRTTATPMINKIRRVGPPTFSPARAGTFRNAAGPRRLMPETGAKGER